MSDNRSMHGPLTALEALRADGGSAVDESAARLAFARRAVAARLPDPAITRDPWGNDPDRTTRNWRPETAA